MPLLIKPGDLCECGNDAEVVKGNAKMCHRCDEIERRMYCCKGGPNSGVGPGPAAVTGQRYKSVVEPYRLHAAVSALSLI